MKMKTSTTQLQSLLSAVEEDLLGTPAKELATSAKVGAHLGEVRDIIHAKLSESRKRSSARRLPDDAEVRRQLLASIIANQQLVRPSMRLAYTSKRHVSDLEVSVLLKKLLSSTAITKKRGK